MAVRADLDRTSSGPRFTVFSAVTVCGCYILIVRIPLPFAHVSFSSGGFTTLQISRSRKIDELALLRDEREPIRLPWVRYSLQILRQRNLQVRVVFQCTTTSSEATTSEMSPALRAPIMSQGTEPSEMLVVEVTTTDLRKTRYQVQSKDHIRKTRQGCEIGPFSWSDGPAPCAGASSWPSPRRTSSSSRGRA